SSPAQSVGRSPRPLRGLGTTIHDRRASVSIARKLPDVAVAVGANTRLFLHLFLDRLAAAPG
ncbi:MAG TPA: hypothetical protein VKX16_01775, partial [Chloroflexota bacterium]|nr:hypothetical protein [Chloroflexota bacterium]